MNARSLTLAAFSLILFLQTTSFAVVTTYNSRAAWNAAIGGSPSFLVDLNDFTQATSFESAPLDLGPFSIFKKGTVYGTNANRVNVPPEGGVDSSPHIRIFVDSDAVDSFGVKDEVELTFDNPIWGWASDFRSFSGGELLVIETPGGLSIPVPDTPPDPRQSTTIFFGFTTSEPISSFSFKPMFQINGQGENDVLDNVAGATVPEPAALAIISAGLSILALRRKAVTK